MEKLCTVYVWIYLIASTQGINIIRQLMTIWCSNNSPSMMCTHKFCYPDTILRSSSPIFCYFSSLFYLSVLSSVGIVMHALSYFLWLLFFCFCLCFLLFEFLLNVSGILFANVWVFVYTVCVLVLFVTPCPDPHSHDYSAHWTIAVLPNVQRQNTDVYFSCSEICYL